MALSTVVEPTVEPVVTSELEGHSVILEGATEAETALLGAYIGAAREYVEGYTMRHLIQRTMVLTLNGFPAHCDPIILPIAPVSALDRIEYRLIDGTWVDLEPTRYRLTDGTVPSQIHLEYGQVWPTEPRQSASVRVEFTSGYGPSADDVPHVFKQAIRLLAGYYYENREAMGDGKAVPLPFGVHSLLSPHRVYA